MFGAIGPWQLILFSFVLLLMFGSRIPGTMRSLGEGIREFKKGVRESDPSIESEPSRHIE